ncbi:L-asparaginase 1 [Bacterioplanes sanyensis]|uniref:asparaginase n=1 Tax=Bacterioplanes sanyensis TaxID=1249553 RepID=UPI001674A944|nr:asparaginase [Bacterioplanes sanyensis]GGY43980.1 L-asparaginase 1 [Bacterioplanes sanyensis]
MTKQHILVIYCGGTIGMTASAQGFVPASNFADALKQHLPNDHSLPRYTLLELEELIDSSNIRCDHWLLLAQLLKDNWCDYDGFVLLHGTDTMAYTASMLSFLLAGQDKPVVITGAQIPLSQPGSDGLDNFLNSLVVASQPQLTEVCICFNQRILRGNASTKVSSSAMDAFNSPNQADLGRVHSHGNQVDIELDLPRLRQASNISMELPDLRPERVAVLRLFPGMTGHMLLTLAANADGLIVQSYGAGNFPDANQSVMEALRMLQQQNLVVVNISQCGHGGVKQSTYASGAVLNPLGVVDGGTMTLEAAFCKLHYLLATETSVEKVRLRMTDNVRGEIG